MFIVWGAQRILLYNQPYAAILADKHPGALGRDFLNVWSEIARDLTPLVERAYAGEAVQMDDITLSHAPRDGSSEEAHFSFSYTPVRGEGGQVAGFFCACLETTTQVLAERRRQHVADRVRAALAIQTVGIIHWGPDFSLTEVNDAFLTMTGFLARGGDGQDVAGAHAGGVLAGFRARVEQVLTRGEAVPYEKQYFREDGFALVGPVRAAQGRGRRH